MTAINQILGAILMTLYYDFLPALPIALILVGILLLWRKKRGAKVSLWHTVGLVLFIIYLICVYNLALPNLPGRIIPLIRLQRDIGQRQLNLIPLVEMINLALYPNPEVHHSQFVFNVIGNIVMFMPFGFFMPLLWKRWTSMKWMVFVGLCTSVSIEFIQYWIGGIADIDDLITNTAGVFLGYLCFLLFRRLLPKTTTKIQE